MFYDFHQERSCGMISHHGIKKSILYGIVAGILLTLYCKFIEQLTLYKVYTLLLNVDYIPFLNQYQFPELVEVSFHIIVSIALSICLYLLIIFLKIESREKIIYMCLTVCIIIGLALFPTTALSDRTPAVTSLPSLFYWLAGHALYGYALGYLLAGWLTKNEQ